HVVVAANDDDPGCSGYTSMTTWCAEEGLEYLVLVHGFLQETGNFELSSIDTGQTCTPPGYCE
ncbi:MAG: hypothetical protein GY716_16910, partial [bacterium]|nr:hypothetical protein [bacterium]